MFVLELVENYKVREPLFEGIRVILSYLGEEYSAAYIQGISGAAFRIGGICPCAPTCSYSMEPIELIRKLGYDAEHISLYDKEKSNKVLLDDLIYKIKREISNNKPVLVWNAFSIKEWDVVCGFDDTYFYGRGSNVGLKEFAKVRQNRVMECDSNIPQYGSIFFGEKISCFDARKSEINALVEAVRHAYTKDTKVKIKCNEWTFLEGISCYKRWVNDFKTNPDKKRTAADSYCYLIYSSTHKAASEFLEEIALKYPKAKLNLMNAASNFSNEVDILVECKSMIDWESSEGPDKERNQNLAQKLEKACNEYIAGIKEIEKALNKLK